MVDIVCIIGIVSGLFLLIIFLYILYLTEKVKKEKEIKRINEINKHKDEWNNEICNSLINKKVAIDMNGQMIRLAWGEPTTIETKEITKTGTKTRWIYGIPRHGAQYIWFKNGIVTKIKQ